MVIGIIGVLFLVASVVLYVSGNKQSYNSLDKMRQTYSDGVNLGVTSPEELAKLVSETLGISMASQLNPDMTISIEGKKCTHSLSISNNVVNIEYPGIDENLPKVKKFFVTFLLPIKLIQIKEANSIMDALVKKTNPEAVLKTDNNDNIIKLMISTLWGSVAGVIITIIMFAIALFSSNDIDSVKNACPNKYPDISYGEAFDNYFRNGVWSSPRDDVVRFEGESNCQGEMAYTRIQFTIKNGKIKVASVSVKGEMKEKYAADVLLTQIFEFTEGY